MASSWWQDRQKHNSFISLQKCGFPRSSSGFIKQWVQEVEIESKGRIKITIPPASLGPTDRQYDLVMAGTADFALMGCVYKRNEWSLPTITDIPFTAPTGESATIALWRTYNKFFAPLFKSSGSSGLLIFLK